MTGPCTVSWNDDLRVRLPRRCHAGRPRRTSSSRGTGPCRGSAGRRAPQSVSTNVSTMSVLGGRRAPGVVLAPADQDVRRAPGSATPRDVDPAAVEVVLEEDLGEVVADLRPGDEDRMAGRGAARRRRGARSHIGAARGTLRRRLDAPVVERRPRRRRRASASRRTGTRRRHRDRRLRVVQLARGRSRPESPFAAPSFVAQRGEELRAPRLVAAAGAEPAPRSPSRPRATSFRVHGVTGRPAFLLYALRPTRNASTSASACRPSAPCARTRSNCFARNASVCGLESKCRPVSATANAL